MKRKDKRKILAKENFFATFLIIKKHFFKELNQELAKVKDIRQAKKIQYPPDIILFLVIMKNACTITSMSEMGSTFNTEESIENISKSLGVELNELPHYDTINNFLKKLEVNQLEKIRKYMINEMLKKRSFEHYRYKDKYWKVAIDATGMFSFKEKHCEHCLKRKYKNKETGEIERVEYYHNVLEAKLVLGDMVFSIATEFIENEHEDVEKQDCELKAFSRLAERLKKDYPKLPICILGDSLYACRRVFNTCNKNRWRYILRFKEGSIPSIAEEFKILKKIDSVEEKGFNFVNEIDYDEKKINIVEYVENVKEKGKVIEKRFVFITDIEMSKNNVEDIVSAGRSRWKIENEGFNNQKNGIYDLEHVCCKDYNAMKNHYILIQIADILRQLLEKGSEVLKMLKLAKKEISSKLKYSFTREPLIFEDISTTRIQIRDL
ncbi:MAG TPA: transposase family protein [Sedimentibacter sp.]|nr:transposase family protein [Sedimentibacter sp.]